MSFLKTSDKLIYISFQGQPLFGSRQKHEIFTKTALLFQFFNHSFDSVFQIANLVYFNLFKLLFLVFNFRPARLLRGVLLTYNSTAGHLIPLSAARSGGFFYTLSSVSTSDTANNSPTEHPSTCASTGS